MEYLIKEGDYKTEQEVVVNMTETTTKEIVNSFDVSEELILKTIEVLNQRKKDAIALIDAEIAINNDMLTKIRTVDRKAAVTVVEDTKEEEIKITK
jgi:prolyl-tRNA editing enzyme YbaK/EbsC (Cys-tRNA(Pro) deacylase)